MIGIIMVGHGGFAKGLISAAQLITGKQENYITLDFTSDITPEILSEQIKDAVVSFDKMDGILIFTDLKGGTPYKESIEISLQYEKIKVLTGTNLAMLIEASLMRVSVNDIHTFATSLVKTGKQQVECFDVESLSF